MRWYSPCTHPDIGSVFNVNSARNISMGSNHGTIIQDSGTGALEEQSYLAALDYLSKHMAAGAIHDSEERCDAPKCMPETRVAVQDEILSWIADGHNDADPKTILWVTGPAGTGKTAILGTLAERCKAEGRLAATFFFSSFSGSFSRRSKTRLVATLAYQLLKNEKLAPVGQFSTRMCQAVRCNPALLQVRLQTQLDELIIHPLRHGAPTELAQHRMTIIIDGLDECDHVEDDVQVRDSSRNRRTKEDEQIEILSAILHAAKDPSFPFVIVIASRPEMAIREFFSTSPAQEATRELFLDEKYDPGADIRLFYESKFSSIRRRFNLSPYWPSEEDLLQLVADASGQFIYATTVVRFVEGPPPGAQGVVPAIQGLLTPHQRLLRIIDLRTRVHSPNVRPLEALDILYGSVVKTCQDPSLSMKWLGAIRLHGTRSNPSHAMPARLLRLWVEQSPGEAVCALGPLASLLYIPFDPDCDGCYTFHHKSFMDFLKDESRCLDLYVTPLQTWDFLSHRYFENMNKHLHRIPRFLVYHTLDCGPRADDRGMFNFSSRDSFKAAEQAMVSCGAQEWVEHLTAPGTVSNRVDLRYTISRMFYSVHYWCPKMRCLPACKHWREAIMYVLRRKGWHNVPSRWDLLRDSMVHHFTLEEIDRFFVPGATQRTGNRRQ
ncbi:hypothetical protein DFP72DRAFT_1169592 [Ephemerocybe angulata]|uniref:Nephrocystin 3-like N-terminal domain-containing protein n=1 Tax=Ephemerocybe angulata TaxID=980116 RepID=A0A8H6HZU1_9AGAR|nr:hypothetical protein DFP72DRAFT_1169592 [Tulosesus angulatus]